MLPRDSPYPILRPADPYAAARQADLGIFSDEQWERLVLACRQAVQRRSGVVRGQPDYHHAANLDHITAQLPAIYAGANLSHHIS